MYQNTSFFTSSIVSYFFLYIFSFFRCHIRLLLYWTDPSLLLGIPSPNWSLYMWYLLPILYSFISKSCFILSLQYRPSDFPFLCGLNFTASSGYNPFSLISRRTLYSLISTPLLLSSFVIFQVSRAIWFSFGAIWYLLGTIYTFSISKNYCNDKTR